MRAISAGEENKSLDQAVELCTGLAAGELGRRDVLLLTFGGGVVGGLGGWVAARLHRGMRYVNVSAALVGQVGAAIGGKLAVSHREPKSTLIGGFHQPLGIVSHVPFSTRSASATSAPASPRPIKKAIIASPAYWELIGAEAEAMLLGDHAAPNGSLTAAQAIKSELIARAALTSTTRAPRSASATRSRRWRRSPATAGAARRGGLVRDGRRGVDGERPRPAPPAPTPSQIVALLRPRLAYRRRPPEAGRAWSARPAALLAVDREGSACSARGALRWVLPLAIGGDRDGRRRHRPASLVEALRRSGVEIGAVR